MSCSLSWLPEESGGETNTTVRIFVGDNEWKTTTREGGVTFDGLTNGLYGLDVSSYFVGDWNYQRRGSLKSSIELRGDFTIERGFLPMLAKETVFEDVIELKEPLKAVWDFGGVCPYIQNATL